MGTTEKKFSLAPGPPSSPGGAIIRASTDSHLPPPPFPTVRAPTFPPPFSLSVPALRLAPRELGLSSAPIDISRVGAVSASSRLKPLSAPAGTSHRHQPAPAIGTRRHEPAGQPVSRPARQPTRQAAGQPADEPRPQPSSQPDIKPAIELWRPQFNPQFNPHNSIPSQSIWIELWIELYHYLRRWSPDTLPSEIVVQFNLQFNPNTLGRDWIVGIKLWIELWSPQFNPGSLAAGRQPG